MSIADRSSDRMNRYEQGGGYRNEAEAAAAFDGCIPASMFRVYKEVTGKVVLSRPEKKYDAVRIDRVLVPTVKAATQGWLYGAIGVEIKRSEDKFGPALSQCMDYRHSLFLIPPSNVRVYLDWIFIWPMRKEGGPLASVMAQNRIGTCFRGWEGGVDFFCGEAAVIRNLDYGSMTIGKGIRNGLRTGSR